jgi:hypothetical protein
MLSSKEYFITGHFLKEMSLLIRWTALSVIFPVDRWVICRRSSALATHRRYWSPPLLSQLLSSKPTNLIFAAIGRLSPTLGFHRHSRETLWSCLQTEGLAFQVEEGLHSLMGVVEGKQ